MEILKRKVDEYEQRDRDCHMIISGKFTQEITIEGIKDLLNDKVDAHLSNEDLRYVLQLGKEANAEKVRRVRAVFTSETVRNDTMSQRARLKEKGIWLSDDLTQLRSGLACQVRQAVKSKKIAQTWVTDSKIFNRE